MTTAIQRLAEEIAQIKRNIRAGQSSPQLGTSSIENGGALEDRLNGTVLQRFGQQWDGTHTVAQMNGPVPPTPTKPLVQGLAGGMIVTWDGQWTNADAPPMDLARVDVHIINEVGEHPLIYPSSGSLLAGTGGTTSIHIDAGDYYAVLVAWTTSGNFSLSAVSDEAVVVSGEYVPPEPEAIPSDSPDIVTAATFGRGIRVTWVPFDDDDINGPYTYDVLASTGTVTTGSEVVGNTTDDNFDVVMLDGDTLPYAPIQVAIRARNSLGPATTIGASATVTPRQITGDDIIVADVVAALQLEANDIDFDNMEGNFGLLGLLQVGGYVELDGATSTITIFGDLEHTQRLVELRPDGSVFRGGAVEVDAGFIKTLRVLGDESEIASGAGVTLQGGVSTPTSGPTITPTVLQQPWPAVPANYTARGISYDETDGVWLRLIVPYPAVMVDGDCKVERINATTGALISTVTLGNIPSMEEDDMHSIVRVGSDYFTMVYNNETGTSVNWWRVGRWTTGGSFSELSDLYIYNDEVVGRPAVGKGKDASSLAVVYSREGNDNIIAYDMDVGLDDWTTIAGNSSLLFTDPAASYYIMWVQYEKNGVNGYVGVDRLTIAVRDRIFQRTKPTATWEQVGSIPDDGFILEGSNEKGGVAKRSGSWYSTIGSGPLSRYSSYVPASAAHEAAVSYVDTDMAYHTQASPVSQLYIPRGRYVGVTLPPAPPGVDGSSIYAGIGTGTPLSSDLDLITGLTFVGRSVIIDPAAITSAPNVPPPVANTFPASEPGFIKSAAGGYELFGNGSGDWPFLRGLIEDNEIADAIAAFAGLLPETRAGIVPVTPTANARKTQRVNFSTPFPVGVVPVVHVQPESGLMLPFDTGATLKGWEMTAPDNEGFTLAIWRTNTTVTDLHYFAVAPH